MEIETEKDVETDMETAIEILKCNYSSIQIQT